MSNNASGLGFGQFVPGFEFLQKLVNPAAAGASGTGGGMPNLGSWVAPTFNVEDLEKRIEELKAVQFWLEQNSKALSATIQAMEVQKMTLATLRDLNVGFGDMARAGEAVAESASKGFAGFEMPVDPAPSPPPAVEEEAPPPEEEKAAATASAGAAQDKVDPMQWWGALQQQFQMIAVKAMQDLAKQNAPIAAKKTRATKPAAKAKPKAAPVRKKASPARKTAVAKKAPARKAPSRVRSR